MRIGSSREIGLHFRSNCDAQSGGGRSGWINPIPGGGGGYRVVTRIWELLLLECAFKSRYGVCADRGAVGALLELRRCGRGYGSEFAHLG